MPVQCDDCGRDRTPGDGVFNPVATLLGSAPGWYSGDSGELCPQCLMARAAT